MPHRYSTWLVVVLALFHVPVARAYGPGVHLREADRYAELHAEVAEPALRPYLHLGAFLPDIRSAGIDLPINTHHKSIGDALLALASESGEAWAVAFATGYRLHTASDTSAQVVFIPWVTAHTGLHAVNLFGSELLGAEADNELLVEGWGDFHVGELPAFLDLVYAFLVDETLDVEPVLDLYVQALTVAAGPSLDPVATRALLDGFRAKLVTTLAPYDKATLLGLLDLGAGLPLDGFLEALTSGLFDSVLGAIPQVEGGTLSVDAVELARLMGNPVGADPATFFGYYEEWFSDLGAKVLDDPGFYDWPWYRAETIVSGILGSMAFENPHWSHRPAVILFDAGFLSPDGQPLTSVDASAAPETVTAWVEVFLAVGGPEMVSLQVVTDPPGVSLEAPVVVASTSGMASTGPERLRLEVDFSPMPAGQLATGLGLELRVDVDEKPFLISDFDQYAVYGHAPVFRAPYPAKYGDFPPTLRVVHPAPIAETGSIRGHVTSAGRVGVAALVTLGAADASLGEGSLASESGAFLFEPVEPGLHVVEAQLVGHEPGTADVLVKPGEVAVVNVSLEPVPIVSVPASCCPTALDSSELRWTADAAALPFEISTAHFPEPPASVEVASGAAGEEPVFQSPPPTGLIPLPTGLADGTELALYARVPGGATAQSSSVWLDASPPAVGELVLSGDRCGMLTATVDGLDDHSHVVGSQIRVVGQPWPAADSPATAAGPASPLKLDVTGYPRPVEVEARVVNGAGLWSSSIAAIACDAPSGGEDAGLPDEGNGAEDTGSGDANVDSSTEVEPGGDHSDAPETTATAEPAPDAESVPKNAESDAGCSTSGRTRLDTLIALLALAGLLMRCRRRMRRA